MPRAFGLSRVAGIAKLVTDVAVFDLIDPVVLGLHLGTDSVSLRTRSGKIAFGWNLDEGIPIARRIVLRRRAGIGGKHGRECSILTWRQSNLR